MNGIYEQTLGITTWRWLCAPCNAKRVAAGWTSKLLGPLTTHPGCCDDCAFFGRAK